MWNGDQPQEYPDQDAKDSLGYNPFAVQIARSILEMSPPEGLVLALYGPWGSGKSTVLNYIQREIEKDPNAGTKPMVVRFNPWWFSGHEDLARIFLNRLASEFGSAENELREAGKLVENLADCVGDIPVSVHLGIPWLFGVEVKANEAVKAVGRSISKKPNIPDLKKEISKKINDSGQRVVVLVDDIDRLTAEEIRQLFRVIKALGDFRNVVYLLAFDKSVVSKALYEEQKIPGEEYLKKIVQVPFELPMPPAYRIARMLFAGMDEIFESHGISEIDDVHFANVFHSGVSYFLKTPRDVIRLLNSFSVTFPAVKNEVNPGDFLGIEALRIFASDVYDKVRRNKNYFAGHSPSTGGATLGSDEFERFHQGWMNPDLEDEPSVIRELLCRLFPKLESIWGKPKSNYGSDFLSGWLKEKRVCSPDRFDIYFSFALPDGLLSQERVEQLLDSTTDESLLLNQLRQCIENKFEDGQPEIYEAFKQLRHASDEIQMTSISHVLNALMKIGSDVESADVRRRGLGEPSITYYMASLYLRLVSRLPVQDRFSYIVESISRNTGFDFVANVILALGRDHGKYGVSSKSSKPLVTADELGKLESDFEDRLSKAIDGEDARILAGLPRIIRFVKDNLASELYDKLVDHVVNNKTVLIAFLRTYETEDRHFKSTDKVAKKVRVFHAERIGEIINLEMVKNAIDGFFDEMTADEAQFVSRIYADIEKVLDPESHTDDWDD